MSVLGQAMGQLADAESHLRNVVAAAGTTWSDAAFRTLEGRALVPLAAETRQFARSRAPTPPSPRPDACSRNDPNHYPLALRHLPRRA